MVRINTTLKALWHAYASKNSARVECPVTVLVHGQPVNATHLYMGFGALRLERIVGKPVASKRGFQGQEVASCPINSDVKLVVID